MLDHSQSSVATQGIEETSNPNVPTATKATSISTTEEPLIPIFNCDFSINSCFDDSELRITNGNEFNSVDIINEPPRAPLSDVSSINKPTDNNELCKLPYQPSIDDSTNITSSYVWFCYKNQCPTESQELANCKSGSYGLISIDAWERNKTIVQSISQNMIIRDSIGEQCLRYYYYFTVYDNLDWGQKISVLIKYDNQNSNESEIDRVSVVDIVENRWYSRNITFSSIFINYTLIFRFEVTNINRTSDPALNKIIYFALDNIDLYRQSCWNVIEPSTSPISTSQSSIITTTTESYVLTASPPTTSNYLGLIL
ncbi:unnamed protein product, partial [Rotaria sordida]